MSKLEFPLKDRPARSGRRGRGVADVAGDRLRVSRGVARRPIADRRSSCPASRWPPPRASRWWRSCATMPGPLRLANGDAIVAVDAPAGGHASDDVRRFEHRARRRGARFEPIESSASTFIAHAGAGHRQLRRPPGRAAPLADRVRAGDRRGRRHPLHLRARRGSAARRRRARRGAGARRAGPQPRAPAGRGRIAGRAGRDRGRRAATERAAAPAPPSDVGNADGGGRRRPRTRDRARRQRRPAPARAGASSPATGGTARRSRRWARRASGARRSAWASPICSRSPTWRACPATRPRRWGRSSASSTASPPIRRRRWPRSRSAAWSSTTSISRSAAAAAFSRALELGAPAEPARRRARPPRRGACRVFAPNGDNRCASDRRVRTCEMRPSDRCPPSAGESSRSSPS